MTRVQQQNGFTLLEVLVAIAIFAVIGLGANQMLRTMVETHDRTKVKVETMNDLTRVFAALERDLGHAVPRYIRDEFGDPQPALLVGQGLFPIELTRTGWSNPINLPRSNLQRVAYEINQDNQLVRVFWLVLDRAEDSEPIEQILLSGVTDLRVSLLTEQGETTNIWPDPNFEQPLPAAIEVFIETDAMGELRKVYRLVDAINTSEAASGIGDAGDDDPTSDGSSSEEGDSDADSDATGPDGESI